MAHLPIVLNREKQDTELSLSQNDTQVLYKNLSQQIEDKNLKLDELERKTTKYKSLFEQASVGYSLLVPAKKIVAGALDTFDSTEIEQIQERVQREAILLEQDNQGAKEELHRIRSELSELDRGKLKLPESNAKLLNALHKAGLEAWCLADLAEVQDPQWTDAVEGWLNTLRLACIVSPDVFSQSLSVYDSLPRSVAGVPLPDIGKMGADAQTSKAREGSLAQVVSTENPWARAYIDCVLGDVMMADLSTLRSHKKAITKECMSWSRYTAIRIKEEVYKQPWLGKSAREKRKTMLIAERDALLKKIEKYEISKTKLDEKLSICKNLIHTISELSFLKESLVAFKRTQEEIKELNAKRDALDISSFKPLQERINQLVIEIKEADTAYHTLIARSGRLKEKIETHTGELEQLTTEQKKAELIFAEFKSEHEHFAQDCERYVEERLKNKNEETILANFSSARKNAETKKQNLLRDFTIAIADYNNAYSELFSADIQEIPNLINRKTKLQDSELPDYIEKIRKARLDAEVEFKDHFIARLNELIEDAKESFLEINTSLKQMIFGRDQYRFTLTEKNERRGQIEIIRKTAQIADYESSLFDSLIQPEDKQAAKELFDRILNSDLQSAELRSVCDYRTYFSYDIRVKDSQSLDPNTGQYAEYSLSKVIKEKSGGEAQTPYYVAIAASFFRFYRDKNNATIRFVLFDEAFDRLDDERIAKVLSFYRELGLQIMISVPTEKIESIAPFMDTVNLVIRHGHTAGVVDFYQNTVSPQTQEQKI